MKLLWLRLWKVEERCDLEIKIAELLARPIKFEPDKLDKFIDSSPRDIILKNK